MGYLKGAETNALKNWSVTIDGTKITQSQLVELKLKWGIDDIKVIGDLTFMDETDLVEETPLRGGNIVVLEMTDYDDNILKQEMVITNVSYTREKSSSYTVTLSLIDKVSMEALSSYIEKSWKEASMIDIIDFTLKPMMSDKKPNFGSPKNKHKDFCIPLNMSLYKLCTWLKENNNMLFFQNREEYIIQPYSYIFGNKGKGKDKYVYKPNNESYRRTIYELKAHYANKISANVLQPKAKVYSMDLLSKEPKETIETYKGIIDKIGSLGTTPHDFETKGHKIYYKSDYNVVDNTEFSFGKNAHKDIELEILVPGQFMTEVGTTVEVDLVNFFEQIEEEKNLGGEWLVAEITDIIIPANFIQKILLTRAKFST